MSNFIVFYLRIQPIDLNKEGKKFSFVSHHFPRVEERKARYLDSGTYDAMMQKFRPRIHLFEFPNLNYTLNGSRILPGKGETAALPRAGHSARFSISGRCSGAVQGTIHL